MVPIEVVATREPFAFAMMSVFARLEIAKVVEVALVRVVLPEKVLVPVKVLLFARSVVEAPVKVVTAFHASALVVENARPREEKYDAEVVEKKKPLS